MLGLFPALFLTVIKLILIIMILGMILGIRQLDRTAFGTLLTGRYLAFVQFCLFFLANALIYPIWDSPRMHYQSVAVESWSLTLIGVVVMAVWLQLQTPSDVRRALMTWLPVGLTVSFIIATAVYLSGHQGARVALMTPNPLVPPLWFLVLTLASFAWFFEMSRAHKLWRLGLLFLAGLMAVYGGARLVMLAWFIGGAGLVLWFYVQVNANHRIKVLGAACVMLAVCVAGIILADTISGGRLVSRMALLSQVDLTVDAIRDQFLRVKIWTGAWSVIADHGLLGIGQVNERIAIQTEIGWDRWFRAHQTYLSYLIAGGIPALISGLMMQSTVFGFITRQTRSDLAPVFLGLGVVITLNCLTDSIFQSAVSVQAFMIAVLLFLKAKDPKVASLR